MSILSTEQLIELNRHMVERGEPTEKDMSGYNKPHFYRMYGLSFSDDLTELQKYAIADTLSYYSNTQLQEYKQDLLDTIKSIEGTENVQSYLLDKSMFRNVNYEKIREEKRKEWMAKRDAKIKSIFIHDKTSDVVSISWDGYIPELSDWVREQKKDGCFWTKDRNSGKWILNVSWKKLPSVLEMLNAHNYISDELTSILDDFDVFIEELRWQEERKKEENPVLVTVERDKDAPDILNIKFLKNFVDNNFIRAFKQKFPKVDARDYCVKCPIILASDVYDFLKDYNQIRFEMVGEKDDNALKDKSCLTYWKDKVEKWNRQDNTLLDTDSMQLPFTPYDFQPADSEILLDNKTFLNANEMGCGKTFEQVLVGESIPEPKLVICPETLRINWENEIHMLNPDADVKIIRSKDAKKELENGTFAFSKEWNIIGYATLPKFHDQLEQEDFNVIMVDEAHLCKSVNNYGNPSSTRGKEVLSLCATAEYVYPITGTPKPNSNRDVFNIFRMIKHPITQGAFAFHNFGVRYCDAYNNGYGWDYSGNSNNEELNEILSESMVRHLKKDVLPNLTKQRSFIPIECNLSAYNKEMDKFMNSNTTNTDTDLGYIMTARRILSNLKILSSIEMADSMLEENKKVVIVCSFSESLHKVKEKYKDDCVLIEGGMSDEEKQASKDAFQNGDAKVCAINVKAGGVGITLTASYNMITNDFEWLPSDMIQVEDRICRGGQTKCCNIFYPYAKGADVDEYFANLLSEKFQSINETVDNGLGENIDFRKEILKALNEKKALLQKEKPVKTKSKKISGKDDSASER